MGHWLQEQSVSTEIKKVCSSVITGLFHWPLLMAAMAENLKVAGITRMVWSSALPVFGVITKN
jgi:hypothetical protein